MRQIARKKGKFRLDDQKPLQVLGRANGGLFADFDNKGRLDLYVTNHAIDGKPYKQPHFSAPNALFRNDGGGKFTDVSADFQPLAEAITANGSTLRDWNFTPAGLMNASGTSFNPTATITRLDLAIAFVRALGLDATQGVER